MTFTVYVWGPAFTVPSLDAECVAAIAYLRAVFHDQPELWTTVEAHDPSLSPTGSFPLLHDVDSGTWTGGFSSIVTSLSGHGYSLDDQLSSRQRADCSALTAHMTSHAPPLIASHLYTSSTTYSNTTHPALTRLLPHHALSYTIPSALRTRATTLAASAGLDSSFSTPNPVGDAGVSEADAADKALSSSSSPSLLFKSKQTLASALQGEEGKLRFRIEAALEGLLKPLEEVLRQGGGRRYLILPDAPTSADCLALGYLALLLYPDVQDSFLVDTMKKRYPIVVEYSRWMRIKLLDTKTQEQNSKPSTSSAIAQTIKHTLHSNLLSHNLIKPSYILTNSSNPSTNQKLQVTPLPLLPTTRSIAALLTPLLTLPLLLGFGYTTRPLWQGLFYDAWYWWRGYSFDYFDPWGGWRGWGGGEVTKVFERPIPGWAGGDGGGGDVGDIAAGGGEDAGNVMGALFRD